MDNISLNHKLYIPHFSGVRVITLGEILYFEASRNLSEMHLHNGNPVIVSLSLKQIEEMYPELPFFRIHKSFLVNTVNIRNYDHRNGFICLICGKKLEIARRRKMEFHTEFIRGKVIRKKGRDRSRPFDSAQGP